MVFAVSSYVYLLIIETAVHLGNTTQWRSQVKLAVQPLSKWGSIKIGLYKAGSHVVEAIPNCRVHHPNINIAIDELKQHALQLKIRGYEEGKNGVPAQGELRYIQMSVERTSGICNISITHTYATTTTPTSTSTTTTTNHYYHYYH